MPAQTVTSGVPTLDDVLGGGLLQGDNVVWLAAGDGAYRQFESTFRDTSAGAHPTLVVAVTRRELALPLPVGVERLNAIAGSRCGRAPALADELERIIRRQPLMSMVIDGFSDLARRWGIDEARRFFVRICPAMLQAGTVTFWRFAPGLDAALVEACRQVTQCMLEVRADRLRVIKAEGRPRSIQGSVHHIELHDGVPVLTTHPTSGRLARGLTALRRDLGLTQAQLAHAAGVTASAISQAESGVRGLSVDTLILLTDRLGVTIDRLVNAEPASGYRLTRHDRGRVHRGAVALADDGAAGMRAFYVALAPGEYSEPPVSHVAPSLVAVVDGLIQVELGADTPVLRAGDSLLAETVRVTAWRNLGPAPAAFYWVLRD